MIKPFISICILTWNRPKFLEICITNLLGKLFYHENCEILIMDNGSTDQTEEILKKYSQNSRIRIIRNNRNTGINAYKKLFSAAKGTYVIEIDDDVLEFPTHFDRTMVEYMNIFTDYGFLALDVIQNEFTNGAKPNISNYTEDIRDGKVIEIGPTGGWCSCFRRKDFRKIRIIFNLIPLSFKRCEDGALRGLLKKYLKLNSGIMKGHFCFHACGPSYAKQYGYLERDIKKYINSNLLPNAELYKSYTNK
jgi:glycosyltransferase involved in cell wall biosynthesis